MNTSDCGVTELTFEEACAAAGGQVCEWVIVEYPDGSWNWELVCDG
ncbi:hypothetical protein [Bradyrhizobium sp. USDA 4520]